MAISGDTTIFQNQIDSSYYGTSINPNYNQYTGTLVPQTLVYDPIDQRKSFPDPALVAKIEMLEKKLEELEKTIDKFKETFDEFVIPLKYP